MEKAFTSKILILLWGLFLATSCTKTQKASDTSPNATLGNTAASSNNDAILIGEVESMTGNEATFGVETYRGVTLAVQEANDKGGVHGKKIKLISSDLQGRPDEGARAISKLITQDKVIAIITGATSSNALAMAPLAQQKGIPLVNTAATNPKLTDLGNYIFRTCFIDPFQGRVMAKFTLESLKFKKIAVLRDVRSDYSLGLADVFTSVIKEGGGSIIIDQSYSGGDIDFRSQLTAIRAKSPEAIFVPGYYTDVSLIARQARELGIQAPLVGGDGWDSPKLKEIGGGSLSGSYFSNFYASDDPSARVQTFLANYKKAYGVEPSAPAAMGYETGVFLIDALQKTPSLNPKDLRETLAATKDYESLNGKMTIDAHRNAVRSAVVLKIEKDGSTKYHSTINP